jgi:hypothetical protein
MAGREESGVGHPWRNDGELQARPATPDCGDVHQASVEVCKYWEHVERRWRTGSAERRQ